MATRREKHGMIEQKMKICSVEGCYQKCLCKNHCRKHSWQLWKYGKILTMTIFDPNEIILYEDYAEIILRNRQHEETGRCLIDLEDVERCKDYKWHLRKDGYIQSIKFSNLSRFLLNVTDPKTFVDHINHNILDNRKVNLRTCSPSENSRNQNFQINRNGKSSKYKGPTWNKISKKWQVQIRLHGKLYYLGSFKTEEEGALAYNEKAKELHGEFACLNVIKPKLKLRRCI